ncbi:MAG: LapA family protein [Gaiellaceae bacterium]
MSGHDPGPADTDKPGFKWTPRRIAMGVVLLYGIILVLLNLHRTHIDFVFFRTSAPLFVLILLALGVGFVLGWLFDDIRARRARKHAAG